MEEQESNIFSSEESNYKSSDESSGFFSDKKPKNDNGNGCNAHFNGLENGSWRHSVADSCGCDGNPEPVPIDGGIWFLLGIGIFIIIMVGVWATFKNKIKAR